MRRKSLSTIAFDSSVLSTTRIRLEPLVASHAPAMFDGLSDPVGYRYIPQEPPTTVEEVAARYRKLESRRSPDGTEAWLNWALIGLDGKAHGYAEVTVNLTSKEAWIAYFVFSASRQQGYASEALRRLLPALRDAYGIAKFNAEIDTRNVASIRLVESLGFVFTKHVKNADEFKGSISDEYHYSLPQHPTEIHIESGRLSIKPFSASDADATFPCITLSLTRFMAWEPPPDRASFDRIWQAWLPAIADGTDFVFAVRQRDSGAFLGLAGLHCINDASAELGIWIREDRHREGIGREAVSLIAGWASRALDIEGFTYPVAEENYPSRRIAESLGGVVAEQRETPKYKSVVYQIPRQLQLEGQQRA